MWKSLKPKLKMKRRMKTNPRLLFFMPYNLKSLIRELTCKECGKHFTFFGRASDYLYKAKDVHGHRIYFCSDKCKREYERKRM